MLYSSFCLLLQNIKKTIAETLKTADQEGQTSVAFPAIGTGKKCNIDR